MAEKYQLIISEKPSAAKRIAEALADTEVETIRKNGASFFLIERHGKRIAIVPAAGHLFVLEEKNRGLEWTYPVFDVQWRPVFTDKRNYWSKKYYDNIESLAKNAGTIYSACDFDLEGSVIAFNIVRFICSASDGRRMKFSTLTSPDIVEAYENASQHLDFEQIEAGLARHMLDYFWGVNVSRALTLALKRAGGYKTLSAGRVQGPTLQILNEREGEIGRFVPKTYWEIWLHGSFDGKGIEAIHIEEKFWEKGGAEKIFGKCKGRRAVVEKVEKSSHNLRPLPPFDLTSLQREAYSHFSFSPKQTLDISQKLYESALISYPRTASQKLPSKIGYKGIIQALWKQAQYRPICEKLMKKPSLKPAEGKKADPAHPAIYPTGTAPKGLTAYEEKVYDLIVKRFLACFGEDAVRNAAAVEIDVNGERFKSEGSVTAFDGWLGLYKPYAKLKEVPLPELKRGDEINVLSLEMPEKQTQPPKRYTQAGILKKLESLNLGTKGTRALILQTLYDRGYIKDKVIVVTELGKTVVRSLEGSCSEIISVELTRKFEEEMERIQEGKKKEAIIEEAKKMLEKILAEFKRNELKIGLQLLEGIKAMMKIEAEESILGACACAGNLMVRTSRASKRFIGCSNYPKCTITFSLPQKGKIHFLEEKCSCSLSLLEVRQFRKRPYRLCVRCGFRNAEKGGEKAEV
ncbi:MAG: DNA topoisomerase I [Candidatus Aenigmarchaeota archaeon]|nr:DNA topoisomerase I [Candidatus Aenigmarchaeota archaeon]